VKISVAIPTYNSSRFIRETLDSVFSQTRAADEILVLDDGSTDDTLEILATYGSKIQIATSKNGGVARARNVLTKLATGDVIAFLDHDDLWHPKYLETQLALHTSYPRAAACFVNHVDFNGFGSFQWQRDEESEKTVKVLTPLEFSVAYNRNPAPFGSASFLCMQRHILRQMGDAPFYEMASGADDFYLCNLLPLVGDVVFCSTPLVAYRITSGAQSANRVKSFGLAVRALTALVERYEQCEDRKLRRQFKLALGVRRRRYGKSLLANGMKQEARTEFWKSVQEATDPAAALKAVGLLAASLLPRRISE
jgi:glycosyltransferase involved in cell wall biosynthesis